MKHTNIEELYALIKKRQPKTSPMIMEVYNELAALDAEISAEDLWLLMVKSRKLSLASMYNYLRLLADVGLVEKRSDDSMKNMFRIRQL